MRLDRFLSENSTYSRSQIKYLLRDGRVLVNDLAPKNGRENINPESDHISLDGESVAAIGLLYLMLHKPQGCVSATVDSDHPTVIDQLNFSENFTGNTQDLDRIKRAIARGDIQVVGRLDLDTTGLLLLTNDGQWNHQLTSPNRACDKTYIAELAHDIANDDIDTFNAGITLKGEAKATRPAILKALGDKRAQVSIHEGKYHQVKRMFASCGNRVVQLHREGIGALQLDSTLRAGQFRCLSQNELALTNKSAVGKSDTEEPIVRKGSNA